MDHLSKEKRSWNMGRIRSKNTKPEILVRSALHKMGYRFRLNGKISRNIYEKGVLPGRPDIILAKYKTAIFVNGCFWHQHSNCKKSKIPDTNIDFWTRKLKSNVERDKKNLAILKELGYKVYIIWECEIDSDIENLKQRILRLMNGYTE